MGELAFMVGAATGIGEATVRQLAAEGVKIALCDVNKAAGEALAQEVGGAYLHCDVRSYDSVVNAVTACVEQFGVPDFAHLNAGLMTVPKDDPFLALEDVTLEQYRNIMSVNVDGVFHGLKALIPLMRPKSGTITVTASVVAFEPVPIDPLYVATKHALVGLVRSVAQANEGSGLRVNAICPGVVDTPLLPPPFRDPSTTMPAEVMAREDVYLLRKGANGEVRVKNSADQHSFVMPMIDIMKGALENSLNRSGFGTPAS